jgi:hypothetical protein
MVFLDNTGVAETIRINAAPDVTIRGVRVSGLNYGIRVENAPNVLVSGVHVKNARKAAVYIRGAASSVTIESTLIEATQPNMMDMDAGEGIDIDGGGDLTVSHSALFENRNHGMLITGAGTKLDLVDTLIENTQPSAKDDSDGYGIYVEEGAFASLTSNAIVGNRKGGASFQDGGTSGMLTENLIERTTPQVSSGKLGVGIDAVDGAFVNATRNAVLHNSSSGIRLNAPGSILQTTQNLVAYTVPSMTARSGVGLEAEDNAQGFLSGDVYYQNHILGILVFNASAVTATGLLVEQTQPLPGSNQDGAGILSLLSSSTSIFKSCAIRDNFVTAIAVAASRAIIEDSIFSGTKEGSFADEEGGIHSDYGDGLTAALTATVTVKRTIMERVARAGILFDESSGVITSCESRENGFGVVIQRMPRPDFIPEQSSVHTNSKSNYVSDGELTVPSAVPGG